MPAVPGPSAPCKLNVDVDLRGAFGTVSYRNGSPARLVPGRALTFILAPLSRSRSAPPAVSTKLRSAAVDGIA